MGFVEHLGERAIVSRMKRLVERMHQDNARIFKEEQIPFEPRWFLVLALLGEQAPIGIMDMAKALGIRHSTVNQLVDEMIRRGFVAVVPNEKDKRRRSLHLTPPGEDLLASTRPLWDDMHTAARDVVAACGYDVIAVINSIEAVLDEKSYYERMRAHIDRRKWDTIEVVPYAPSFKDAFKTLNRTWIEPAFTMEPVEKDWLNNPQHHIIKSGGWIGFAHMNETVVGTCALIKGDRNQFRLDYLTVAENYRHQRIGKKLVQTALDTALTKKATRITAECHHQMGHAINLLRQMGFTSKLFPHSPTLTRNDVFLEYPMPT